MEGFQSIHSQSNDPSVILTTFTLDQFQEDSVGIIGCDPKMKDVALALADKLHLDFIVALHAIQQSRN